MSLRITVYRSSCPEVFCKEAVLKNFAKLTEKHLCWRFTLNKVAVKEETPTRVFSREF